MSHWLTRSGMKIAGGGRGKRIWKTDKRIVTRAHLFIRLSAFTIRWQVYFQRSFWRGEGVGGE